MSPSRFLKLEILGCVLLLGVTLGILLRAPKAPWEGKDRLANGGSDTTIDAPHLAGDADHGASVRTEIPPIVAPLPKPKPPAKAVTGKLVVIDAEGREVTDRSGVLFLKVQIEGESAEVHRVVVTKGSFALDAYVGCFLACDTATIDEQYALADLPRTPIPDDGTLVVRARIPPRTRLFVEDAASGTPLTNVGLRKDRATYSRPLYSSSWELNPGDLEKMDRIVQLGSSPLEIPNDVAVMDGWVDVPGYAPQRVRIETAPGGDYLVRLQRAAALEISIVPNPLAEKMVLLVCNESAGEPLFDGRGLEGLLEPIRFERVDPGRYVVRVVSLDGSPTTRAESRTELAAGETKQMALELAPSGRRFTVRGTIHVPRSWPRRTILEISGRDAPNEPWLEPDGAQFTALPVLGGDPEERSFEFERSRSRTLRFEIDNAGIAFERTIEQCEQPLRFELPEPATVRVRLRTETGKPYSGNGVLMVWSRYGGSETTVHMEPNGPNEDPTYLATLAPGEIELDSHDPAWLLLDGTRRKKVIVTPGDNEIALPIRFAKEGLLVQFAVHGAALNVPDATLRKVVVRRANGEVLSGDPASGGVFVPIGVRETLEIVPPQVDGYQPAAPFTVDVDPSTSKRIAIELTPKT